MEWYIRTPTLAELNVAKAKALQCFEAAATATGCTVGSFFNGQLACFLKFEYMLNSPMWKILSAFTKLLIFFGLISLEQCYHNTMPCLLTQQDECHCVVRGQFWYSTRICVPHTDMCTFVLNEEPKIYSKILLGLQSIAILNITYTECYFGSYKYFMILQRTTE